MSKPKLVKFWAEWCAPCHKMEPVFAALEREFGDRLEFVRVNVDEQQTLAALWHITSVPTLLLTEGVGFGLIADLTSLAFKKEALRARLINDLGL